MLKILVTGGAGYIGSHTVKELKNAGFDVVVLDSLETGHKESIESRAEFELCDLADKEKVRQIFKKHKPDAVIDFAAYLAVGESMEKPEKYLKNNVENFVNLLDVMSEVGCKYIIKSSTASTYGNPEDEKEIPFVEDYTERFKPEKSYLLAGKWEGADVEGEEFFQKFIAAYNSIYANRPEIALSDEELAALRIPLSIYGLSKMLDEVLLKKYDKISGIKSIVLRYFNVCGADPEGEIGEDKANPTTLMVVCILHLLGKIPELKVFGNDYKTPDGTGIRDYIHVSDIAAGHVSALNYLLKTSVSDTFNLGTSKGSTVLEVIAAVNQASGKKVAYSFVGRRSGDPAVSVANSNKAEKMFEWKAKYSLADMAKTAWNWHTSHPKGFNR
ncbi:MAG: UDP-glucose 4-epimerase [Patescibacteria group bacterium]|jgi:UDP-glucose 4-epimerase